MFIALKSGLNLIADVSALGLAFQHAGVATSRRFILQHPDVVRRYIKSHVEAVHRIKSDRDMGLKVTAQSFSGRKTREYGEEGTRYMSRR